ncbi:hypothetical protein HanXRQr2_Chr01g0011901 [Helianthus annuus]|uniref:Uncharacterized protein n=1 Tax=Helianthus annuus TaxID=4232 RepID=A0A9K3P2D0_HELAN|nr:hypothetical protein HanXRQr2_Chr01g0011901 [Helianthus annuus]KAJ0956179.1 hypothetical protein HanPSC8_Chr01g0011651 [Helianthus annuus]
MIDPNIVILIILKIKKVKGCIFQSNRSNRVLTGTQLPALVVTQIKIWFNKKGNIVI